MKYLGILNKSSFIAGMELTLADILAYRYVATITKEKQSNDISCNRCTEAIS